jgi:hypothetical protein
MLVIGSHEPSIDVLLRELSLEIKGCASWFGTSGIGPISELGEVEKKLVFEYQHVTEKTWSLAGEFELRYGCRPNINSTFSPERSIVISETAVMTATSAYPIPFKELMQQLTQCMAFVEFLQDSPNMIEKVFGQGEDSGGPILEFNAAWKQGNKKGTNNIAPLVPFASLRDNFGDHVSKWIELYKLMPLALDLYRTCKQTHRLQVEFRFFTIVSALESFHRTIVPDESPSLNRRNRRFSKTLQDRLKELVQRHEDLLGELLPTRICARVADTRNYLAHQTPELEVRAFPSGQWFLWYRRLELVFEICVLAELPFSEKDALKSFVDRRMNGIKSGFYGEWNFEQGS